MPIFPKTLVNRSAQFGDDSAESRIFFFFQAEDGIRDLTVTGVQTCALPILSRAGQSWGIPLPFDPSSVVYVWFDALINYASAVGLGGDAKMFERWWPADQIGRASCRERV